MVPRVELTTAAATTAWLVLLSLVQPAEAYDAGDGLALLLGVVLAVAGGCVFLGWYARRRNGQL
ncbi:small integral membrane protein 30-like [Pseudoliparis swirei]|uniref:small integral membrane protein 30-like n=1 Tax=Pseudoliparis swirei TaxID=2059687 RepID=UPI0024BE3BE6|nr:small integral membrane protein 30-like [Pseudoliparis swirei]